MQKFHNISGLKNLAKELKGNENIYLGIRPYGFHSGNALVLYVYPLLLMKEMKKLGIEPKLNFFVFINDYEQAKLDGPDLLNRPFNVHPKCTTLQQKMCVEFPDIPLVDYWQRVIEFYVKLLLNTFPKINIKFVRNSEMKNYDVFKSALIKTIKNPEELAKIFKKYSKWKVPSQYALYASAVCPKCRMARGFTEITSKGNVTFQCSVCGSKHLSHYEDFDYWFYHKPLAVPRIESFKIDLCITGSDHHEEGDFEIRKALMDYFNAKVPYPKTLYTPTVFLGGRKMGKSKGNAYTIKMSRLEKVASKADVDFLHLDGEVKRDKFLQYINNGYNKNDGKQ